MTTHNIEATPEPPGGRPAGIRHTSRATIRILLSEGSSFSARQTITALSRYAYTLDVDLTRFWRVEEEKFTIKSRYPSIRIDSSIATKNRLWRYSYDTLIRVCRKSSKEPIEKRKESIKRSERTMSEVQQKCLREFLQVLSNVRPYLIQCYDHKTFPRTNNDTEREIRGIKTRYRRISGRKNWNSYLLRYGRCVVFYEWWEHEPDRCSQLEHSLRRVPLSGAFLPCF